MCINAFTRHKESGSRGPFLSLITLGTLLQPKMLARSLTVSLGYAALACAQSASLAIPPAAETLAAKITPAELPLFDKGK